MQLTRIDMNSWIMQIAGQTVLIDPWLLDPLVFYGKPWLYEGYHVHSPAFTPDTLPKIDLILISQGLDDHCHRPTLAKLDRSIPVVASPDAAKVVKQLGYSQVTAITNWEEYIFVDRLQITAIPGAIVGAQTVENGYYLKDISMGESIGETAYYEPHLFRAEVQMEQRIPTVDVAIAPVIAQVFPLLGEVVQGPQQALQLVKTLHPHVFVPTTIGEVTVTGLLPMLTKSYGSVAEFRELLLNSGEPTELLEPQPGETLNINKSTLGAVTSPIAHP